LQILELVLVIQVCAFFLRPYQTDSFAKPFRVGPDVLSGDRCLAIQLCSTQHFKRERL